MSAMGASYPPRVRASNTLGPLGFTPGAVAATPACANPGPTPVPACTSGLGTTQCVENLTVRGLLNAPNMLGSTLTLTGLGGPDPDLQSILTVQGGARIYGVSEHGEVRVRGDSCMAGYLSVNTVYGPTEFSNPSGAAGDTVTVIGGTTTDTLLSGTVTTDSLQTTTAVVDDLDANPKALANALATLSSSIVGIVAQGGEVPPSTTTVGFVLANPAGTASTARPFLIVTTLTSDYSNHTEYNQGDAVSVVTNNGLNSFNGIVRTVCPAASIAIIACTESFVPTATALLADNLELDEDSPDAGVPVFVPRLDLLTGTLGYTAGAVSNSSVNLLDTFTSVTVSLGTGSQLSDTDMGGPIFMLTPLQYSSTSTSYAVKIVGMLHHGCPGASDNFLGTASPALAQTAGGAKARVIRHVVNQAFLSAPITASLPLVYEGDGEGGQVLVQARGITVYERGTTAAPGGVLKVSGVVEQYVQMQLASMTSYRGLGSLGQNHPSLTDTALYFAGTTVPGVLPATMLPPASGATTIVTVPLYMTDSTLYTKGSPVNNFAIAAPYSTVFDPYMVSLPAAPQLQYINSMVMKFNIGTPSIPSANVVMALALGQFGAQGPAGSAPSAGSVTNQYYNTGLVYIGTFTAVNNYIQGLPLIAAAWNSGGVVPSSPDTQYIMAVAANTGSSVQFASALGANYKLVSTSVVVTYTKLPTPALTVTDPASGSFLTQGPVGTQASLLNSFSYFQEAGGAVQPLSAALYPATTLTFVSSPSSSAPLTVSIIPDFTTYPSPLYPS
jgi:hypothetical protein